MNPTRRTFLASAAAGLAAIGLGETAVPEDRGGVKREGAGAPGGWDSHRLSQAVLDAAVRDFSTVHMRARHGVLSAGDVRAAGASGRTLFAHFNEIRLTDTEEREARGRRDELAYRAPDDQQVRWMHDRLVDTGIAVSRDQVREMLGPPQQRRVAALDALDKRGLRAVRASLGPRLDMLAERLDKREGPRFKHVAFAQAAVEDPCKEFQWVIDVIALTAGLNAVGCAAGVVPCCAIAVAEGLVAATLQLVHDVFC